MPLKALLVVLLPMAVPFAGFSHAASSSRNPSGGTEEFKLRWDLPCTFSYPDDTVYPYDRAFCDFALAKDPAAQRDFNQNKLSREQSGEADKNQKKFLETNAAEAKKALAEYDAKKAALLKATRPSLADSEPKALNRVRALTGLRKRIVDECPPIAAPFGGGDLYLKDCNTRLAELDGAIEKAKAKVPEEQKVLLEKTDKKVFLGKGSAAGLKRTAAQLGGKGGSGDATSLGKLFENRRSGGTSGTPKPAGRTAGILDLPSGESRALGGGGMWSNSEQEAKKKFKPDGKKVPALNIRQATMSPTLASGSLPTGVYSLGLATASYLAAKESLSVVRDVFAAPYLNVPVRTINSGKSKFFTSGVTVVGPTREEGSSDRPQRVPGQSFNAGNPPSEERKPPNKVAPSFNHLEVGGWVPLTKDNNVSMSAFLDTDISNNAAQKSRLNTFSVAVHLTTDLLFGSSEKDTKRR